MWERDGYRCIFCGRFGLPNAHVVNRSQGGLGIEQNIVTACTECHTEMDNGKWSLKYREAARIYLAKKYQGWNIEDMKYRKGDL